MRITKLQITEYKNLKDFSWELSTTSAVTVIVGKNASGKTNLLEAITLIFQYFFTLDKNDKGELVKPKSIPFEFEISYMKSEETITIKKESDDITITVNDEIINFTQINTPFLKGYGNSKSILPERVFLYYAGIFDRMKDTVKNTDKKFKTLLESGSTLKSRSFINYEPIQYKFIFFALLTGNTDNNFLETEFNINTQSFEAKLYFKKKNKFKQENEWNLPLNLNRIFELLNNSQSQKKDWNSKYFEFTNKFEDKLIRELQESYGIFENLDILYLTELVTDMDILFTKNEVQINFDDLSEGEKQRLAIRGAMEIFRGKETLFLLDEPDAFAHPRWQWEFVPEIQKVIGENNSQQVLFVTHSPIILSTLSEPAFVIRNGQITEMNSTFGNSVNETLAEQDVDYRQDEVAKKLKHYIIFIQQGKANTKEAKELRAELDKLLGSEHPELKYADDLIDLYE